MTKYYEEEKRPKTKKVFIAWVMKFGRKQTVAESRRYATKEDFKQALNELGIKFEGVDVEHW